MKLLRFLLILLCVAAIPACAVKPVAHRMEATAYCGCGKCCSWERGRWKYLKLNFWNRYVSAGKSKGRKYTGRTASGTKPHEPYPGFFSKDSLRRPWVVPYRLILFPWFFMPRDGPIAADTDYYRFGTRMYVPGYGWGMVEDRGSAIKGPERIDLYHDTHKAALKWGRRKVNVLIKKH